MNSQKYEVDTVVNDHSSSSISLRGFCSLAMETCLMDGNARHLGAFKWAWICVLEISTGTDGVVRVILTSNDKPPVICKPTFRADMHS